MYKILDLDRGFPQIPIARSGILKITMGSSLCPGSFAQALGNDELPLGIFEIPAGLRGSGLKSPLKDTHFLFIFFYGKKRNF